MYIPKTNSTTDTKEIVAFMKRFSFATIITSSNNIPTATHLPFIVSAQNDQIVLTSHFARANGHWKEIENQINLVIFSEPHAYISPKHYDGLKEVPTWNYLAVHAYGPAKLVTDADKLIALLENTIVTYEEGYKKQWDTLPQDYKTNMMKGIVGFEIEITDLQAKKKLSQNKTAQEQQRIITHFIEQGNAQEKQIADYMVEHLSNSKD